MPRKTRTTSEQSADQVLKALDDIRLTVNDVKFNVRLMAVHQEATLRTIQRWVDHLEEQETKRALQCQETERILCRMEAKRAAEAAVVVGSAAGIAGGEQ